MTVQRLQVFRLLLVRRVQGRSILGPPTTNCLCRLLRSIRKLSVQSLVSQAIIQTNRKRNANQIVLIEGSYINILIRVLVRNRNVPLSVQRVACLKIIHLAQGMLNHNVLVYHRSTHHASHAPHHPSVLIMPSTISPPHSLAMIVVLIRILPLFEFVQIARQPPLSTLVTIRYTRLRLHCLHHMVVLIYLAMHFLKDRPSPILYLKAIIHHKINIHLRISIRL